jgi:hypothetical protein
LEGGLLTMAEGEPFLGKEGHANPRLPPEEGEEDAGDPRGGHG